MAAMEKGIPLPELPFQQSHDRDPPNPNVLPILGTVLLSLSIGAMIMLNWILPAEAQRFWVSPLPFTFF